MEGKSHCNFKCVRVCWKWQLTACADDGSEDGNVIKSYKKLLIMEESTEFCCSYNTIRLYGWSQHGKIPAALPASIKPIPRGFVSAADRDQ